MSTKYNLYYRGFCICIQIQCLKNTQLANVICETDVCQDVMHLTHIFHMVSLSFFLRNSIIIFVKQSIVNTRQKVFLLFCALKMKFYEIIPVKPLSHQSGVLTAFPQRLKNAERRGARCANTNNAVELLCNRLDRHAAAFTLSMLKTNAAAWRFHSVLDSTLWQRYGNAVGSFRAPWARCERAACTL